VVSELVSDQTEVALLMWFNRTFRKWWRTLPDEHRAYWRSRLLARRQLLYLVAGGILTFGIVHYVTHISETPVTHRRRYLAFTKEQFVKLSEFLYNVVILCFVSFVFVSHW